MSMSTESSHRPGNATVAEALDRLPLGRFHHRLLAICGSAWAFDGMEVIIISFTLPALIAAWGLSGLDAGLLGAASLMGMIVGNWGWGWVADRNGRTAAFQWTVLMYSVFTGLTALAPGYGWGFVLRFLTGVGLGGALAVDTAYLSEHLPTAARGRYLVYLDAFWPLGNILAVGLAWLFLSQLSAGGVIAVPGLGSVADWRLLFVAAALPALLVFALRRGLRETPYFLARTGRVEEANERLAEMARSLGTEIERIPEGAVATTRSPGFRRLFQPDVLRASIVIGLAWFAINLGYYGVFIWLPTTASAAGLAGGIYLYLLAVALVQLPGYASAAYLVERWGRRATLGTYLVLSGIFTFVFAVTMPGVELFGVSYAGTTPFLVGLLLSSFFALGAWGAIYAYTPELFPTEARATGMGYAGGVGKVAAVVGPILAGALLGRGYLVAILPLALAFAVGGVIVLLWGTETKGEPLR